MCISVRLGSAAGQKSVPPAAPSWQPPNWQDFSVTYSAAGGQSGDADIRMWADVKECITDVCARHWCCWMPHGWHLNSPFRTFTFQSSATWKHSGVPVTVKVVSQVPLGAGGWNLALYVLNLFYFLSVSYHIPILFALSVLFAVCLTGLLLSNAQCDTNSRMNIERWIGRIWKEAATVYCSHCPAICLQRLMKIKKPAVYTAFVPTQFWTRHLRI